MFWSMADNYLEYHWEEYEKRKAAMGKKKHVAKSSLRSNIEKPADEGL